MRPLLLFSLFAGLFALNTGCQTSVVADFARLKPGMEKPEVLDIMGSPNRTQRWRGMDRWVYKFYENEKGRDEREVHFDDGKAVYLGARWKPEVTAEEQDQRNEVANREVEDRIKKNREQAVRNLEDYETQERAFDENATVPQFEPVQ